MFEGFGQVILEAMSSSLPIITKFAINTAGKDIIENGKNGYLTDIRDVNISKDILHNIYDKLRGFKNAYCRKFTQKFNKFFMEKL